MLLSCLIVLLVVGLVVDFNVIELICDEGFLIFIVVFSFLGVVLYVDLYIQKGFAFVRLRLCQVAQLSRRLG